MIATKKSSLCLLCLLLAMISILGVFATLTASSAASQAAANSNNAISPLSIVISPTELVAELPTGDQVTSTLWITNTSVADITFTILEMSARSPMLPGKIPLVSDPVIDAALDRQIATDGTALAIISLHEQPDLSPAYLIPDKAARARYVYDRLLEVASHSHALFMWLDTQGTHPRRLLMGNAIAATINHVQFQTLAAHPQVRHISANHHEEIIPEQATPQLLPPPVLVSPIPDAVEWNIARIRADQAWSDLGVTGEGAVVGIIDTGVQFDHPALVNSYRGTLGGGVFDHNYNWFDFVSGIPIPYDDTGHGTWGAGIVSGDDGGINQIGVAPGADWIAVKACDSSCSSLDLVDSLEWMLAPTDLSGTNPDPSKAPNVVLGMWGGSGCDPFFVHYLQALRAAGILPVFPPGGGGPSCGSMGAPANLPVTMAAGATDQNDAIASFSARGPGCDAIIKPDLSAPGVNIRTSDAGNGYTVLSGTSWSAAHAAGAAALVYSANPSLGPDEVFNVLTSTAVCFDNPQCGGDPCPGANNVYGHGRIDVYEAVIAALTLSDPLPWLAEFPPGGTLASEESLSIEVTFDATDLGEGTYSGFLKVLYTDPEDSFLTVPVTLTVVPACQPVTNLEIAYTPEIPIAGEVVTFTATADGSPPIQFSWTFDGVVHASGHEVTYSYADPGFHETVLTAENACSIGVTAQVQFYARQRMWLPFVR